MRIAQKLGVFDHCPKLEKNDFGSSCNSCTNYR